MTSRPGIGGVALGLLAVVVAVAIGVAVAASRGTREDGPASATRTPTPTGTRVPQEASPRSTPEGGEAQRDGG